MSSKKTIIFLILRLICIILFPLSYVLDPKYAGEITFFTVQSNLIVLILMIVFSIYDILKLSGKFVHLPDFLNKLKLIATTAITLTFIVFGIILTPILVVDNLSKVVLSYSSIVMHQIIPIVAILDFLLDDENQLLKYRYAPITLAFPLYYFVFTLIVSKLGVTYPSYENGQTVEAKFPYFFLDYEDNTWFKIIPSNNIDDFKIGVFYWLVIILIILISISFLLILLKNLVIYTRNKKQSN